ncbi:hypothetical protein ASY01nite_14240 [Acetobacter syzygii]|uniref:hypothetical protein n=1 Tax=Acetobacter syzygii TaxID=146476 RepID=UPI00116CED4D|nr:hypothetical protein [Acetobacter syzygii]GBR64970.1 hypothetical protein AA0483_1626 [Acetobacter syzygii NRIC 0483]GEL56358.1 hypothetical protein ASY01nite_14240 [Acetobacter syzygii]
MKRPPPSAQWFHPAIARRTAARIMRGNGRPLVRPPSLLMLCAWRAILNVSKYETVT